MIEIRCVVDAGATVGEGPLWDWRENALWWVDIPSGEIFRHDPATGQNRIFQFGEPVGCLALRAGGGLVLAAKSGFHLFDPWSGAREAIYDPEIDRPGNRFNDGATDRQGRFWAGTMKDDGGPPAPDGAFYRLDSNRYCQTAFTGFYTTNGLAFSPDGRRMYFADTNRDVQTIWVCDYDPDEGVARNQRVFFDARQVAGRPDGGTVDADGFYWMAGVSGWQVLRIAPDGRIDRIVEMPVERPSKPMWGGPRLETLYVTSIGSGLTPGSDQPQAGGLFAIEGLGTCGLMEASWPG